MRAARAPNVAEAIVFVYRAAVLLRVGDQTAAAHAAAASSIGLEHTRARVIDDAAVGAAGARGGMRGAALRAARKWRSLSISRWRAKGGIKTRASRGGTLEHIDEAPTQVGVALRACVCRRTPGEPHADDCPGEWTRVLDEQREIYLFVHSITGETVDVRPDGYMEKGAPVAIEVEVAQLTSPCCGDGHVEGSETPTMSMFADCDLDGSVACSSPLSSSQTVSFTLSDSSGSASTLLLSRSSLSNLCNSGEFQEITRVVASSSNAIAGDAAYVARSSCWDHDAAIQHQGSSLKLC